MTFTNGQTVVRVRAKPILDPYSNKTVGADWSTPDEAEIDDAFVAQSSTSRVLGASRTQMLEYKSLYCRPDADVHRGDKIRVGTVEYEIDGFPAADVNPFTGWQPVREVPLTRVVG